MKKLKRIIPENTREYVDACSSLYYKASMTKGCFEYYALYEEFMDKQSNMEEEVLPAIQNAVKALLLDTGAGTFEEAVMGLDELRKTVIKKMHILTYYTDRLLAYEYVLNRMELKFNENLEPIEEEAFADKLLEYMFEVDDNTLVNQRIQEALSQLPVRITKTRFFERILGSLSVYKGSEKESVESYLYMLRTSSMLYIPEGLSEYFTEYKEIMDKFEQTDFSALTKETYVRSVEMLEKMAEELVIKSDFYVNSQVVINSLYTAVMASCITKEVEWDRKESCLFVLRTIYNLFQGGNYQPIPNEVHGQMVLLEGQQERIFTDLNRYEAVLLERKKEEEKDLCNLEKMGKLMSTSIFIELDKSVNQEIADASYIREVCDQLIGEYKELFSKHAQPVNRAVMASVLGKLPVFFEKAEEVMDYVKNSLEQCGDPSEKQISMRLLNEIMEAE